MLRTLKSTGAVIAILLILVVLGLVCVALYVMWALRYVLIAAAAIGWCVWYWYKTRKVREHKQ